jgi:hypothetical protein
VERGLPRAAFIFLTAAMVIAAALILTTRRQSAPDPGPVTGAA